MAFDLNNPFTFTPRTNNFLGTYQYVVSVTPDDPTKYNGVPFITVTSSDLLTENQILEAASNIALNQNRYGQAGTALDLEITEAFINPNQIPEI